MNPRQRNEPTPGAAGAPAPQAMNTAKDGDHPHVIALPPLLFLLFIAAGFGVRCFWPMRVGPAGATRAAGVLVCLVAAVLAIWARQAMKASGTHVRPDRPTLAIVTDGPFRFTRNPLYLSLCLLQLAAGLLADDWTLILLTAPLALALHFGAVMREEAYLERKFGATYLDFKRQVRRWI